MGQQTTWHITIKYTTNKIDKKSVIHAHHSQTLLHPGT